MREHQILISLQRNHDMISAGPQGRGEAKHKLSSSLQCNYHAHIANHQEVSAGHGRCGIKHLLHGAGMLSQEVSSGTLLNAFQCDYWVLKTQSIYASPRNLNSYLSFHFCDGADQYSALLQRLKKNSRVLVCTHQYP